MKVFTIFVSLTFCSVLMLFQTAFSQSNKNNKAIVQRYFEEIVNKQRVDLVDEIFSKDYHSHILLDSSESTGSDGLKKFLPYLWKAFPDIHYSIGDIITEGDKVAIRVSFSGTHKGEFFGVQPSNNRIDYISEIFFFRIEKGKIKEGWVHYDLYNLLKKLKGEKNN